MAALGQVEGLAVRFGDRTALDGVDLEIPAGEVTVVVGPSGSGKTTLLRALNRLNELFPGHRRRGRVLLDLGDGLQDVGARDVDVAWLRRRVAMVFQTPNVLPLSIERNLTLPLDLTLGLRGDEARPRVMRALADAELLDAVADRLHERATTLSGGQQQRLCLARALALQPHVLLLDEPTSSLDFRASRRIEALIRHLAGRYTIVAVSHSIGQAARIADRVVVLSAGRVVDVLGREALERPEVFRQRVEDLF